MFDKNKLELKAKQSPDKMKGHQILGIKIENKNASSIDKRDPHGTQLLNEEDTTILDKTEMRNPETSFI